MFSACLPNLLLAEMVLLFIKVNDKSSDSGQWPTLQNLIWGPLKFYIMQWGGGGGGVYVSAQISILKVYSHRVLCY